MKFILIHQAFCFARVVVMYLLLCHGCCGYCYSRSSVEVCSGLLLNQGCSVLNAMSLFFNGCIRIEMMLRVVESRLLWNAVVVASGLRLD